jgi:hypothetical protein
MTGAKRDHLRLVTEASEPVQFFDPGRRGYSVLYRGASTPCPGCGRSHWHVGRLTAECAFCAVALGIGAANG